MSLARSFRYYIAPKLCRHKNMMKRPWPRVLGKWLEKSRETEIMVNEWTGQYIFVIHGTAQRSVYHPRKLISLILWLCIPLIIRERFQNFETLTSTWYIYIFNTVINIIIFNMRFCVVDAKFSENLEFSYWRKIRERIQKEDMIYNTTLYYRNCIIDTILYIKNV